MGRFLNRPFLIELRKMKSLLSRLLKPKAEKQKVLVPLQGKSLKTDLNHLQRTISYNFNNNLILEAALTHSSCGKCKNNKSKSLEYERMEFFGDAVLGLITVEFLFERYTDKSEGDLSKLKSNIVSENYLSIKAQKIDLGSYIRLGDEEFRAKGYNKKSILANMMESLICAIYLDGGLEKARQFVRNYILKGYEKELQSEIHINYKSILQEHFQSKYQRLPDYKTVSAEGPDHQKIFTVNVSFDNEKLGSGTGLTKKAAEQDAAREACQQLGL